MVTDLAELQRAATGCNRTKLICTRRCAQHAHTCVYNMLLHVMRLEQTRRSKSS